MLSEIVFAIIMTILGVCVLTIACEGITASRRYKKIDILNSIDFLKWLNVQELQEGYEIEFYEYLNVWERRCIGKIIKNDFGLKIDLTAKNDWAILVYIDDILVYESDGHAMHWKHTIPKEMQDYIYDEINRLNNLLKYYKNKDKIEWQERKELEAEYLIKKFG